MPQYTILKACAALRGVHLLTGSFTAAIATSSPSSAPVTAKGAQVAPRRKLETSRRKERVPRRPIIDRASTSTTGQPSPIEICSCSLRGAFAERDLRKLYWFSLVEAAPERATVSNFNRRRLFFDHVEAKNNAAFVAPDPRCKQENI
jgi:hypothetical protein